MGQARKNHQHVTPRLYLRGFADERGFLDVRRRSGAERTLHLSNVAVRRRFYTFKNTHGVESDAVEEWLNDGVENPCARLLRRLREGASAQPDDAPLLARFVAAQLLRTPSVEATLMQLDSHIGPMLLVLRALASNRIDPATVPRRSMDHYLRFASDMWERRPREGEHNSRLRTVVRKIDELTGELSTWDWSVLCSDEPLLITGDAPVVTTPPNTGWAGILPAGSPVYLPLTPHFLLVGDRRTFRTDAKLGPELAAHVNQRIAVEADDAVMKSPGQAWPHDLVLAATRPSLPSPSVRWGRSQESRPTFPARFPAVADPAIKELLDALEATDLVE